MIISWLKIYALQASLITLGAVSLYAAVQTWRLGNAQETIAEQRQLIVDVKAANLTQQATIEALRKANADWSAKCRAEPEKWKGVIAKLEADKESLQESLKNAPTKREVIYREVSDKCHAQPVPDAIKERLK